MKKDVLWAWITRSLVIIYVTLGGGYEIYSGITKGVVHSSFIFAFLSGSVFIGRIGYGITSGAKKTIPTDLYGLTVMWTVAFMKMYFSGW
jgi:hypothetical protein